MLPCVNTPIHDLILVYAAHHITPVGVKPDPSTEMVVTELALVAMAELMRAVV
ncbi:MAG: hypothetical protein IPH28_12005 [Cytophagaceae bacterium]|nr:hypothetical protein [Cytophagaceae bacterium]MBK9932675.1 hypothetical protein [Cytophagaceae bacterium]MBL0303633.1 hypothetical protein [Cytophagaceae bacterium]